MQLFRPINIQQYVWALSKAGHADAGLLDALCERAVAQLGAFSDHQLGILLRALVELGHQHDGLLQAVAKGIASEEAVKVGPCCAAAGDACWLAVHRAGAGLAWGPPSGSAAGRNQGLQRQGAAANRQT
jgi:hypothetical protein